MLHCCVVETFLYTPPSDEHNNHTELSISSCMPIATTCHFTCVQSGVLDWHAGYSALSLVGARVGQLYSAMQAERSRMIQDMVNILYDKTNDAQEGVVSMLLVRAWRPVARGVSPRP